MKTIIKGHTVSHEKDVAAGVRYLIYELAADEAKVFFDEAYNQGSAIFEDHMGYKYKLVHHGSEYQLVKHI
ncbi:MAG: hypothetical protein NT155_04440 [Candidatus Staskawiczbacteria bacterium]|nr:hypothetical protein [Candidatus Staskawiczbacteria bacterium]